jgi:hypothetical protein
MGPIVPKRRYGITTLNKGPTGCPETSVLNCHSTLRKIPEVRRPQANFNARTTGTTYAFYALFFKGHGQTEQMR